MKIANVKDRGVARERDPEKESKNVHTIGTRQKAKCWELRLYVAGNTANSLAAFANLRSNLRGALGRRISY